MPQSVTNVTVDYDATLRLAVTRGGNQPNPAPGAAAERRKLVGHAWQQTRCESGQSDSLGRFVCATTYDEDASLHAA